MGINRALDFTADVFRLGNWRLILSLLGCVSAFTIGAIIELGINFLPIIDKIHLVSIMGFYVLTFYFMTVILSYLWKYTFNKYYFHEKIPYYVLFFQIFSLAIVFSATIAIFYTINDISYTSYNSRNFSFIVIVFRNALSMALQNTLLVRLVLLLLFILALRRLSKFIIYRFGGDFSQFTYGRISNQLSLCLAALLMLIFLEAGSVWTRISYFTPPGMSVSFVDPTHPDVRVGIVMRAQDGFVGVAEGNHFPEYFGFNSIRRITPIGR